MVVSSVTKTGAFPFSKSVTTNSPPPFQNDHLACDPASPTDNAFFNLGLVLSNNLSCYSMSSQNAGCPTAVDCGFILPASSALYIEASRPISRFNKESLASVLEFADESGCNCVFACIRKDISVFDEILRSYCEAGFASVTPLRSDMVKVQFDI